MIFESQEEIAESIYVAMNKKREVDLAAVQVLAVDLQLHARRRAPCVTVT